MMLKKKKTHTNVHAMWKNILLTTPIHGVLWFYEKNPHPCQKILQTVTNSDVGSIIWSYWYDDCFNLQCTFDADRVPSYTIQNQNANLSIASEFWQRNPSCIKGIRTHIAIAFKDEKKFVSFLTFDQNDTRVFVHDKQHNHLYEFYVI